jgi:hypothetical protein
MTDTPTTPETAPPAPASDVAAAIDWKQAYEKEVESRKYERNLYKPVARLIEGLHDDDRETLVALADAVRAGDADAVINWNLSTAERLAGKSVADLIAERQQQSSAPTDLSSREQQTQAANPAMTEEQVQAAVRAAIAAEREQVASEARRQAYLQQVTGQLKTAGIEPGTADASEVIEMARALATREPDGVPPIDKAIRVWQTAKAAEAAGVTAAAQAAGQIPAPVPAGAPAANAPAPEMSHRDRVIARLTARQT